ncbi:MAG: EamA family transporter [Nannocystaceae bacterium]|nr:EamA family transporter [bacterium]
MTAIAQLLAASLLWSLSFGLIKTQLGGVHPAFVGFARLAMTLPVFVPFLRPRLLPSSERLRLVLIGGVQYGLAYSTYLYAYRYLDGHHVALLTIFTPLYVVLFDAAAARRAPWVPLCFAALAVLGAAVIQYRGASWQGVLAGALLMQVANACFAWGQLAYRSFRRRHPDVLDHNVFGLLFIGGTAVAAVSTTLLGGWSAATELGTDQLVVLAYLGVIASGLGFFLWNRGAVHTPPATLAVMNNLKIPFAVAASVLVFSERTDPARLLGGGGLMIAAAVLAQRWANRDGRRPE